MTVERKLLLVDLRDAQKRPNVKACPTCGVGASQPTQASLTDQDYIARANAERLKLERAGWNVDFTHADTKRFINTIEGHVPLDDLVFVVALWKAT